jgi:membrane-bound serine protease (ClpP class)
MSNDLIFPVVLQAIGVCVIISEFVLPSAGLLTVAALAAFGYSLFHVFHHVSADVGMYFLAADVVVIPLCIILGIKLLSRSPVTLRKALSRENGVASQDSELQHIVGKTGEALTTLRPAGKAMIAGVRLDVVSTGDYIEKGTAILVSAVDGNRIVVRENLGENY